MIEAAIPGPKSSNMLTLTDFSDPDAPRYKMLLKNITPRLYQETILGTCANKNTLVVIPTGLGKTVVALMLAAQRIQNHPNSKVLFLAPTKPLVEQHLETFKKHFDMENEKFAVFTGSIKPEKRAAMWEESQVIFSTPQGFENDLISDKINLENVSLIIFDEAHRATGEYAYTFVAKQYAKKARYPRILALTASPGNDLEKINEICQNLHIEDVELRTEKDPDVAPYVQQLNIKWVGVDLPTEFSAIQKHIKECYTSKLRQIKQNGYLNDTQIASGKKELLRMQSFLHAEIGRGDKSPEILKSVSLAAEAMKAEHALELLETQGIGSLQCYFDKIYSEADTSTVKAVKNLANDPNFKMASLLTRRLAEQGVEHPKIPALKQIVDDTIQKKQDAKIIIFNQFRESAKKIAETLNSILGVRAEIFVGQAKKNGIGLSQKEQKNMLTQFTEGAFNCLVATSVAEEGIDIPSVDLVVFYEPVPSGIRTIQRRGRTGRQEKGEVIVLMAKGTRDEAYRWSAHRKEKHMKLELNGLKARFTGYNKKQEQQSLATEDKLTIVGDYREKASGVMKELVELGAAIDLKNLTTGDYVLSPRVVVEFKRVPDFVDSIIDGRLLEQAKKMKEHYDRPMIIIEGEEDIYAQRNIYPNAIRGMLATLTISYGIPVLQTRNPKETAELLNVIARREKEAESRDFNPHGSAKPKSISEQQEYMVSSLPGVGPLLARPLLEKFGNVRGVMLATEQELQKIDKIGEKKAKEIQRALDSGYKKE